nr:ABC-three component system middle component 2 [Schaalia suimastitidis]
MSLIQRAIPFAVTRGLIVPDAQGGTICYTATEQGRRFVDNLDSQYVRDYKTMLTSTLAFVDSHAINDVLAMLDGRYPLTEGGIQ